MHKICAHKLVFLTLFQEADDEFWAATDPYLQKITGKYFVNQKSRESPSASYNKEIQQRLWQLLEQQTGARFPVPESAE